MALKLPFRCRFQSDQELAAMLDEACTAARLEPAAIVPVCYFGREPDGTLYLAMKYLEGRSLAERLCSGPLELRQAAEYYILGRSRLGCPRSTVPGSALGAVRNHFSNPVWC